MLVVWGDAHAEMGVFSPEDIKEFHKEKPTFTVGFLMENTDRGVTLSMDCWEDPEEGGHTVTFIPRWMVHSCHTLSM